MSQPTATCKPEVRAAMNTLIADMSANYGVQPGAAFTLTPSDHETVVTERLRANPFMERINRVTVEHPSAKTLFGKLNGVGTGTKRSVRTPKELTTNRVSRYEVGYNDFDYVLPYEMLDLWFSRAGGSQEKFAAMVREWYAQKRADETAAIALRGVNLHADNQSLGTDELKIQNAGIGFEQLMRNVTYGNPANVWDDLGDGSNLIIVGPKREISLNGAVVANNGNGTVTIPLDEHGFVIGAKVEIMGTANYNGKFTLEPASDLNNLVITKAYVAETIGATGLVKQYGQFENLDSLVTEAVEDLIPENLALTNPFEVMLSRKVAAESMIKLYSEVDETNPVSADKTYVERMAKSLGGYGASRVMGMKPRQIKITPWSNLSYYEQQGTRRQKWEERPEMGGFVEWNMRMGCYSVENVEACIVINNIHQIRKHADQK